MSLNYQRKATALIKKWDQRKDIVIKTKSEAFNEATLETETTETSKTVRGIVSSDAKKVFADAQSEDIMLIITGDVVITLGDMSIVDGKEYRIIDSRPVKPISSINVLNQVLCRA